MKNLTSDLIILIRQDGTRAELPPCETPPTIEPIEAEIIGYLGELEIVRQPYNKVHFHNWEIDPKGGPYIVSKLVFDALPPDRIEFVTPDYNTAILNGLMIPHVIRRFIAKPAAKLVNNEAPAKAA